MSRPDSTWSREELELLRSAVLDAPARDAQEHTLAALGVGGAVLGSALLSGSAQAAGLAAAAPSPALLGAVTGSSKAIGLLKVLGAVVALGAMGGAVLRYRAPRAPEAVVDRASAPSAAPRRVAPTAGASARGLAADSAPPEASAAGAAPPSSARASAPAASPTEPDILLEIAALDRARRASERGDFRTALAELDAYERGFKRGRLRPEALVLRIQTLINEGDVAGARNLGARFLAKYPKSPLAPRIQKLIGSN
jgi:hypothetical protein